MKKALLLLTSIVTSLAVLNCNSTVAGDPAASQTQEAVQKDTKQATESKKEEAKFTKSGHTVDSLKLVRNGIRKKEAVLVDVREQFEWDQGHLADANLVPLSSIKSKKLSKEMEKSMPKEKVIYLHCKSGGRVLMATKVLREMGYDVRPLKYGYTQLLKAGFKKAKDKPEAPSSTSK